MKLIVVRGAFSLALLGLAVLAPASDAQFGQSLSVDLRGVKTTIDATTGRLMPIRDSATILWIFDVAIPPATVCTGAVRMYYELADVPPYAHVTLSRSFQDIQNPGIVPSLAPTRISGFSVDALVVLDGNAPAFYAFEVRLMAMAAPVNGGPPACAARGSPPVQASALVIPDYLPGFIAKVGDWSEGVLPLTLVNQANGGTKFKTEWGTSGAGWVAAEPDVILESVADSGSRAVQERVVALRCLSVPWDATGELRVIGDSVQGQGESTVMAFHVPLPPSCPVMDDGAALETENPMHALPGAGLSGSLVALAFAALRRR